jgi:simple sugar transport system permease protein
VRICRRLVHRVSDGRRLIAGLFAALALGLAVNQLPVPPQFMSALPYLATVGVLIAISRRRGIKESAAPASLGLVFAPER